MSMIPPKVNTTQNKNMVVLLPNTWGTVVCENIYCCQKKYTVVNKSKHLNKTTANKPDTGLAPPFGACEVSNHQIP